MRPSILPFKNKAAAGKLIERELTVFIKKGAKSEGVTRKITPTSNRCGVLICVEGSPEEFFNDSRLKLGGASRWFRWQVRSNVDAGAEKHNAHTQRIARPAPRLFNELRAVGNDMYCQFVDHAGGASAFKLPQSQGKHFVIRDVYGARRGHEVHAQQQM